MYLIEIQDSKVEKLSEHIEKSLKHMGKAMQCVEEWMEEGGFGERGGMNYRGGRYGNRYEDMTMRGGRGGYMGYRDDEDDDEWEEMQERRGGRRRRDSMGRYR